MNITPIIEALAVLIAAVITGVIVPYIKSRTSAQQQEELLLWVRVAVTAAEQIYTGTGLGKEKKEYVLNWLAMHGIAVDVERIDAMIESAVYAMNQGVAS